VLCGSRPSQLLVTIRARGDQLLCGQSRIGDDLAVLESDCRDAESLQDLVAGLIGGFSALAEVWLSVELDRETEVCAVEVEDEIFNAVLTAELPLAQVPAAKNGPHDFLRVGGGFAVVVSVFVTAVVSTLVTHLRNRTSAKALPLTPALSPNNVHRTSCTVNPRGEGVVRLPLTPALSPNNEHRTVCTGDPRGGGVWTALIRKRMLVSPVRVLRAGLVVRARRPKEDDVSLFSSTGSESHSSDAGANQLRVAVVTKLAGLDIRKVSDATSHFILGQVFEPPYGPPLRAPAGTPLVSVPPQPILFTEQLRPEGESKAGGATVYSAELRPGILFSDGTPLTPELLLRSLLHSEGFTSRARVESRGNRIVFTLRAPNARFDHFLTQLSCAVVLEKNGRFYGTGPYILPEPRAQEAPGRSTIVLRRNPHSPQPPSIEEIAFIEYGSTSEVLAAIKRGEVDFTTVLNSTEAAELRGLPFTPVILEANSTAFLHFNTTRPALADPRIRKAIAHVVEKKEIAAITYEKNPLAYMASGITPAFMGRDPLAAVGSRETKETLAAAGVALPKSLTLLHTWAPRPYLPDPVRAAKAIQKNLAGIGIDVAITNAGGSREKYVQMVRGGEFDLLLAGWIAETADPADFFDAILSSAMIPTVAKMTPTSNNVSRWSYPPMDAALAAFRSDPSEANRAAIVQIVADEMPLLPLIHGKSVTVYGRRVRGFEPSPLNRQPLSKLELGRS
jgi:ABC-type transport system substrate-binding protein